MEDKYIINPSIFGVWTTLCHAKDVTNGTQCCYLRHVKCDISKSKVNALPHNYAQLGLPDKGYLKVE